MEQEPAELERMGSQWWRSQWRQSTTTKICRTFTASWQWQKQCGRPSVSPFLRQAWCWLWLTILCIIAVGGFTREGHGAHLRGVSEGWQDRRTTWCTSTRYQDHERELGDETTAATAEPSQESESENSKEAALNTKEAQLRSFLEQVRVHVKNEKDRHAQETPELKQEIEDLKMELEQLRDGKLPTKEADEQSLDAMLISDSEADHGAKERQLQEELSLAKQQAASANEMAYAMKAQLDSLMAQFQTMRHLQPSGMTPPGSEDLKALGGAEASVAGGGPPLKDPKGPFGLRHQQRERHGPYTTSPAKPVEKPVEQEAQLLPETMD